MMNGKQEVIELLSQLPEDVALHEISEEIAILAAIRRGQQAAAAGRVVPHEEVKKKLLQRKYYER
jgi:predicted transcriptional regulator